MFIFIHPSKDRTYYVITHGGRAGSIQFFVQSISLSPLIRIISNFVCVFLVMILSAVHKNHNSTLYTFWVISLFIDFYRTFLFRSISLSPLIRMNSNFVCVYLVMIQVHKNHYSTLYVFWVISLLINYLRTFLVWGISLSPLIRINLN